MSTRKSLNMKTKSDFELSQLIKNKGSGWIKASIELAARTEARGEDPKVIKERALQPLTSAERRMAADLLLSSNGKRLEAPLDEATRNYDVTKFGLDAPSAGMLMAQYHAVAESPAGTHDQEIATYGLYSGLVNAGRLAVLLAAKLCKEAAGK